MLDVGPSSELADGAALLTFVDRVAARSGDRPTATARLQIRKTIEGGDPPAGLRSLAEALAGAVGNGPPAPRRPVDDVGSVPAAVQTDNFVVLADFGRDALAAAVTALLADGRRVVVTAADRGELHALRAALPTAAHGHCVDALPALSPGEQRMLRRLLATSTPARRAREDQQVPPSAVLPAVDEVVELCRQACRTHNAGDAGLIPGLLAELDPERRAAVTGVARCAEHQLSAMRPREDRVWAWSLLSDLVLSRHRPEFDLLLEGTVHAAAAAARSRNALPVSVVGALPPGGVEVLRRYLAVIRSGGRSRAYFRSGPRREVAPVLARLRVGGAVPATAEQVDAILEHIDLAEQLTRIGAACRKVGVPAPNDAEELTVLADGLTKVAAAARSVGALRHDVLFIHPSSPIAVPDLAAAEQIVAAILEYADHGSTTEAEQRLDRLAAELESRAPAETTAPEHTRAVTALRERNAADYPAAVDALAAARRDVSDQRQRTALLGRLHAQAPRLAQAWTAASESGSGGFGLAWFVEIDRLLDRLPGTDQADVVFVLGASELGVERLLLTAVAPRLVAVCGAGGQRCGDDPTMCSVLARASALVLRRPPAGRSTRGRVVRLPAGATHPVGAPSQRSPMEQQAGA